MSPRRGRLDRRDRNPTLDAVGERAAVDAILARLAGAPPGRSAAARESLLVGPGDDAAALALPAGEVAVLTTDTLVEGVHFERAWTSALDLGYKLIQSATSDVAAMGARPRAALVAVSAPGRATRSELLALADGMIAAAQEHGVVLAGGDTTEAPLLVLTASILGSAAPAALRTRGGARPGDRLAVTGELGDAGAGLLALTELHAEERPPAGSWLRPESALAGLDARLATIGVTSDAGALVRAAQRLLRPSPPVAAGPLAAAAGATALIDISDGLASELGLIAAASAARLVVDKAAIPIAPGARAWAARAGTDPLALALHGGEDYELLIAYPPEREEALTGTLAAAAFRATAIGEVTAGAPGIHLRDLSGLTRPLAAAGYEHFRRG